MTPQHYEKLCEVAVWALKVSGRQIGEPQLTHDGLRYRDLDGLPATDDMLFTLAWGGQTAQYIRQEISVKSESLNFA